MATLRNKLVASIQTASGGGSDAPLFGKMEKEVTKLLGRKSPHVTIEHGDKGYDTLVQVVWGSKQTSAQVKALKEAVNKVNLANGFGPIVTEVPGGTGEPFSAVYMFKDNRALTKASTQTAAPKKVPGYLVEWPDADDIAERLNKKVGSQVKGVDYASWMDGDWGGSIRRFDKAVRTLMGDTLYEKADNYARLSNLLDYMLGIGPDRVGGISMAGLVKDYGLIGKRANKAK